MVAKLSSNVRQLGRAGDDTPRQIRAIEEAFREFALKVEQHVNRFLPTTRGGFSPFTTEKVTASGKMLPDSCKVYLVDTDIAAMSLRLPAPVKDWNVIVLDAGSNAAVNNITITRPTADTLIQGAANDATITTNNGVMWLICDGRDYWKL